jgi:hypothetical protein
VDVKDDQLTIKTSPIISPVSGKESIHTLVWERMKMTHSDIMAELARVPWRGRLRIPE